jgi:hypothetical protein
MEHTISQVSSLVYPKSDRLLIKNTDRMSLYCITTVPLMWNRHTGLDPVSSGPLKLLDSASTKNAVRNDGGFICFHVV